MSEKNNNHLHLRAKMLKSANLKEFVDSLGENHKSPISYHHKITQKERENQVKFELDERSKADKELENKLSFFDEMNGSSADPVLEKDYVETNSKKELESNIKEEIQTFYLNLQESKKSSDEILKTLIEKYEDQNVVSVWVENWKNFLRLHEIADNKPPKEKRAIQSIITKADYSSPKSFTTSLTKIQQSEAISSDTKNEILREFKIYHIATVDDMDRRLKKVRKEQKLIKRQINKVEIQRTKLGLDITALEKELEKLDPYDEKRDVLKKKLKAKNKAKKALKSKVKQLKSRSKKEYSFELRPNFEAVLNKDGSRSIKIYPSKFIISIPSNRLPFQGLKNIRSINTAFVLAPLQEMGMADTLFRPELEDNGVPAKEHREMTHLILKSLGFNDDWILTVSEINELHEYLATLQIASSESGEFNLRKLGVYNNSKDRVETDALIQILKLLRK